MSTILLALLLLVTAASTGIITRFIPRLPLPLVQIAVGTLLALPQNTGLEVALQPDVFLLLFIPPLLFVDAWQFPQRELMSLRRPIVALALGLVLFTVVGMGLLVHWLLPALPLPVAFALAAILSPTDAVAVSAITRQLPIPPQLLRVLEGESLMNDASGLVAFKFAVAAAMTGTFSLASASMQFVVIAAGGIALGSALAFIFSTLRRQLINRRGEEASTEIVVLVVVLPFAAYWLAEQLGASGILAAVAAGITLNRTELKHHGQTRTRMQMQNLWEMLGFVFNALVFLLLGLQLPDIIGDAITTEVLDNRRFDLHMLLMYVAVISLTLLTLRAVWIIAAIRLSSLSSRRRGGPRVPASTRIVSVGTLAGIRGTITLAAALSLPVTLPGGAPLPGRELVIFIATGVIVFTLILGSITLPILLRGLKLPEDPHRLEEERRAREAAAQAAIEALQQHHQQHESDDNSDDDSEHQAALADVTARLISRYRQRLTIENRDAISERLEHDRGFNRSARLAALRAERREYYRLRSQHRIDDNTLRQLVREIDLAEMALGGD